MYPEFFLHLLNKYKTIQLPTLTFKRDSIRERTLLNIIFMLHCYRPLSILHTNYTPLWPLSFILCSSLRTVIIEPRRVIVAWMAGAGTDDKTTHILLNIIYFQDMRSYHHYYRLHPLHEKRRGHRGSTP